MKERIYDYIEEVFKPEGASYEYNYNAKGNFYAVLFREEEETVGVDEKMEMQKTVVYDRVSENGECHIFVYYETWYGEDGTEYATTIRNSYAVNMMTGEITPSGKTAWDKVGTEEYRTATGEE